MTIWELRFVDGRGATVYTEKDVTAEIGKRGRIRRFNVAAVELEGAAIDDARRCLKEGNVVEIRAHMATVAFAVRHDS
jgi:hypothetical protein